MPTNRKKRIRRRVEVISIEDHHVRTYLLSGFWFEAPPSKFPRPDEKTLRDLWVSNRDSLMSEFKPAPYRPEPWAVAAFERNEPEALLRLYWRRGWTCAEENEARLKVGLPPRDFGGGSNAD